MITYDEEISGLFHDLMSLNCGLVSGLNLLRNKIINKEDYQEIVPLIDKRFTKIRETYKVLEQKIMEK
ncbi:MAG: hypothetical protein HQK53_15650 [Oligoflexia bacterium]|nr:hypothetical protein [Oligoflexia bacterium]